MIINTGSKQGITNPPCVPPAFTVEPVLNLAQWKCSVQRLQGGRQVSD